MPNDPVVIDLGSDDLDIFDRAAITDPPTRSDAETGSIELHVAGPDADHTGQELPSIGVPTIDELGGRQPTHISSSFPVRI